MQKTLTLKDLNKLPQDKKIVLVGGAFDILHLGHITFLQKARKEGEILVCLLESDQTLEKLKGIDRPINTQLNRAKVLEALSDVDFIILLSPLMKNEDYDTLVKAISPVVIAATRGDKSLVHKKRQAAQTGAKLKIVTSLVQGKSTTELVKMLYAKRF